MAAYSRNRGIVIISKPFLTQIWKPATNSPGVDPLVASALAFRRGWGAHASVYDKNLDEQVRPSVVPDEVIQQATGQSDKYWAPHPRTGVFGPVDGPNPAEAVGSKATTGAAAAAGDQDLEGDSALEHKAWFRPTSIEDLEKPAPPHH